MDQTRINNDVQTGKTIPEWVGQILGIEMCDSSRVENKEVVLS